MKLAFKTLGIKFTKDLSNFDLVSNHINSETISWSNFNDSGIPYLQAKCIYPHAITELPKNPIPHEVPDELCSCGIYSTRTVEQLGKEAKYYDLLFSVGIWGKIIEGERGFRSEYAGLLSMLPNCCNMCKNVASNIIVISYDNPYDHKNHVLTIHRCSDHTYKNIKNIQQTQRVISYSEIAKKFNIQMDWSSFPDVLETELSRKHNPVFSILRAMYLESLERMKNESK